MTPEFSGTAVPTHFQGFLNKVIGSENLTIYQLAGDASTRRYYRITSGHNSWVLMVWDPFNPQDYPFLSVQKHLLRNEVHVPLIMDMSPSEGLVLLEDLGDLTLERKFWENQDQNLVLDFYKLAIDELIKIHYPATQDRQPCKAFDIAFDTEKFLWEMNYGLDHVLIKLCKMNLTEKQTTELKEIFLEICQTLHKEEKLISHRDYHSRNLMIHLNKMRVIDFQDARLGPIQYDLVSLLRDSYVNLSEKISKQLLDYYFEQRRDYRKDNLDLEHFRHIYELQSIQRCFKACGSFASFYNLRKDTRYLKYLPHTGKRVIKCLKQFPKYKTFANILTDSGISERPFDSFEEL